MGDVAGVIDNVPSNPVVLPQQQPFRQQETIDLPPNEIPLPSSPTSPDTQRVLANVDAAAFIARQQQEEGQELLGSMAMAPATTPRSSLQEAIMNDPTAASKRSKSEADETDEAVSTKRSRDAATARARHKKKYGYD